MARNHNLWLGNNRIDRLSSGRGHCVCAHSGFRTERFSCLTNAQDVKSDSSILNSSRERAAEGVKMIFAADHCRSYIALLIVLNCALSTEQHFLLLLQFSNIIMRAIHTTQKPQEFLLPLCLVLPLASIL
jgi:hypothetical protein